MSIRNLLFFCLLSFIYLGVKAQNTSDSVENKSIVKLDLVPFYNDLFDSRVQARVGLEYERLLSPDLSVSGYLDIGLYDQYTFTKYYNFFNENQGFYYTQLEVKIKGYHLLPACNYYYYQSADLKWKGYFSGQSDLSFYHKNLEYRNSLTAESYSDTYNQIRLGIGLGPGIQRWIGKKFCIDFRTSLFFRLFNTLSKEDYIPLKSLDAQWTSNNYKSWWITNLKVGYAF